MTKISYPTKWDDIVDVNCFKDGKHVKNFSNFNGDFNSCDVEKFCESLAVTGEYSAINVSCCNCN